MTFRNIRPEQYIAAGQLVLAACIVISTILLPQYFFSWNQGGVSNYGTRAQTVALYGIGFGAAGVGVALAAATLPKRTARRAVLRITLLLLAALYALVLYSTFQYKFNNTLRLFHEHAAQALLVGGLMVALYLRSTLRSDPLIKRAFVVFGVGLLLAILTLLEQIHLLFTAQLLCGGSFGYMLTRGVRLLAHSGQSKT